MQKVPRIIFVIGISALSLTGASGKKPITYAMISYPVIDLFSTAAAAHTYSTKPCPASTRAYPSCPRIHQGLFNEVFPVEEKLPEATCLTIPWAIYDYDAHGHPQARYWASNTHLRTLSDIPAEHRVFIPFFTTQNHIITLKLPWSDKGTTFSVGTEFVYDAHQSTPEAFAVYYLHPLTHQPTFSWVAKKYAFENKILKKIPARKRFIKLLTEFVSSVDQQESLNTIPYVWGGSSFTTPYSASFLEDKKGFHRQEAESAPLAGYDCSNLILRFAHMARVPYFFKTTAFLKKKGKKISSPTQLQEGDLIWLPGHVVVITDLKKGLITESSGYANGPGKVRTIPLSYFLENITTMHDLFNAYKNNHTISLLDTQQNPYRDVQIGLFKLF